MKLTLLLCALALFTVANAANLRTNKPKSVQEPVQEAVVAPKFQGRDEAVDCDKCGDLKHITDRPKCANWCAEKRTEENVAGAKKGRMDKMDESMQTRRSSFKALRGEFKNTQ